jgi:hypothetical protein
MADRITSIRTGSGLGHCFFCDTRIEAGWPCVERVWYHAGGSYNGSNTGVCPVGLVPECAHVQCAFRLDTKGGERACAKCNQPTVACRRVVNFIASRDKRCSETNGLTWCLGCMAGFVEAHRAVLDGWLGAEQQQQGVAWVERPLWPPAGLQAGCGLPPMATSSKEDFLSVWRSSSEEAEALAVERHRALQSTILEAMRTDRALAGSARPPKVSTPVERKARRLRIDSRSDHERSGRGARSRSRSPRSATHMRDD